MYTNFIYFFEFLNTTGTNEELEWWKSQHEWQDATVRSVSARRTKLRAIEREIDTRETTSKTLRKEIKERRRQLNVIHEKTTKSRKGTLKIEKIEI